MKRFKKISNINKFIIIYSLLLIIMMIVASTYVYSSLILFENNQEDRYMKNLIVKLKNASSNGNINNYVDISSLNKEESNNAFKEIFNNTKITYKEENDKYIILTDDNPLLKLNINKGKELKRLGILKFNKLSNDKITLYSDRGLYYNDIIVPSNFKVYVNDKLLKSTTKEVNKDFEEINNDILPTDLIYKVDNLLKKPKIEILNNAEEKVDYEILNNKIINHDFFKTNDEEEAMEKLIEDIDVIALAEKWSLFMTKDLKGTRRGFDDLSKNLIKNSMMWNRAYQWLTGIDINFVSTHTLKDPIFTNIKLNDFEIYNDSSFSCFVHLDKNLIVNGKNMIDSMNDRLYFVYKDDAWKLVDMRFVSE